MAYSEIIGVFRVSGVVVSPIGATMSDDAASGAGAGGAGGDGAEAERPVPKEAEGGGVSRAWTKDELADLYDLTLGEGGKMIGHKEDAVTRLRLLLKEDIEAYTVSRLRLPVRACV